MEHMVIYWKHMEKIVIYGRYPLEILRFAIGNGHRNSGITK